MSDPAWVWPFWKFGLKKDDLFTTLHDQYNTFPSSIQDPEAFHHDVFECSHEARSPDEFHHLLANRKEQRLRELNDSLESASLEIIANPSLIGTEQWQFALQLFRTKSLDSLVRYFSSYLPDNHPWHGSDSSASSVSGSSVDEPISQSVVACSPSFFDDANDKAMFTHEPFSISTCAQSHLPLSPRSMTMCSEESSDVHHTYMLNTLTPARTLSFSESESERFTLPSALQDSRHLHDDETSQYPDPETPISEFSDEFPEIVPVDSSQQEEEDDVVEVTSNERKKEAANKVDHGGKPAIIDLTAADMSESETPTPKPEAHSGSFFEEKVVLPRRQGRSLSPSRPHPLSQVHTHLPNHDDDHGRTMAILSPTLCQSGCSPGRGSRRKGAGAPAPANRIQKTVSDRVRTRQRRLVDC